MVNRFDSVSLATHDTKSLVTFYHEKLGLPLLFSGYFDSFDGAILGFEEQNVKITVWDIERWEMEKGTTILSFLVDDLDDTYAELINRQVEVAEPPLLRKWGGKSIVLYDPDGNKIVLFDRESEFSKPAKIGPPEEIRFIVNDDILSP